MNAKLEIIFFALAGIAILIGFFWAYRTERRLRRFFLGRKGKDLEEAIESLEKNIADLTTKMRVAEERVGEGERKQKHNLRGLETVRFNPFPDQGGNQSFAIGILDESGDGVVLSSLYARERMSVFAKPIRGGKSEYDLSQEEKEALWKAKEKIEKMQ